MYMIDYNSFRSNKSFNRRVRFLVFHYTAGDFSTSMQLLTGDRVSAHYLVPDSTDSSYVAAGFNDMRIFNLVDENERAWHAGRSSWQGRNNLNDSAIGIEIVNRATDNHGIFDFPPFTDEQIKALTSLSLNILQRYPDITPTQVVGHSDIASGRKSDPGAAFPWKKLYEAGIGAWYNEAEKTHYSDKFKEEGLPSRSKVLENLQCYGYDIADISTEQSYNQLIRAFQLHFRPTLYDGRLDIETAAILYALVDKYRPNR